MPNQNSIENSGLLRRFAAYFLDFMLCFALFLGGLYLVKNDIVQVFVYIFVAIPILAFFNIFNFIYLPSKIGGSIGKKLFGLAILRNDKYLSLKGSFLRGTVGYRFSAKFLGLGFFRIIKNPDNLGWHDELFKTRVVKRATPFAGIFILLLVVGFNSYLSYEIFLEAKDKVTTYLEENPIPEENYEYSDDIPESPEIPESSPSLPL
jgi:uncharacterized RDD family membrane protein YckC